MALTFSIWSVCMENNLQCRTLFFLKTCICVYWLARLRVCAGCLETRSEPSVPSPSASDQTGCGREEWMDITWEIQVGRTDTARPNHQTGCGREEWMDITWEIQAGRTDTARTNHQTGCGWQEWMDITWEIQAGRTDTARTNHQTGCGREEWMDITWEIQAGRTDTARLTTRQAVVDKSGWTSHGKYR